MESFLCRRESGAAADNATAHFVDGNAVMLRNGVWERSHASKSDAVAWPSLMAGSRSPDTSRQACWRGGISQRPDIQSFTEMGPAGGNDSASVAWGLEAGDRGCRPLAESSRPEDGPLEGELSGELDWDSLLAQSSAVDTSPRVSPTQSQARR